MGVQINAGRVANCTWSTLGSLVGPTLACHFSALLVGQACWVVETLGKQRTRGKRGRAKAGLWGSPSYKLALLPR